MSLISLSLLPWLMGGCPQFRNGSVDALDAAAKSILLGGVDPNDALSAASLNVVDGAIGLIFDQFRTDDTSR